MRAAGLWSWLMIVERRYGAKHSGVDINSQGANVSMNIITCQAHFISFYSHIVLRGIQRFPSGEKVSDITCFDFRHKTYDVDRG